MPLEYQQDLNTTLGKEASEFLSLTDTAIASVGRGESTEQFAMLIDLANGVTGYCYHSVPVALHAWLSHQDDYRSAVLAAVRCGGDTDTTGAITGAIDGARVGRSGLPQQWLSGLWEWPRTLSWMQDLAEKLALTVESGQQQYPPGLFYPAVLLRNALFAVVVIGHGFRRLLPPF